MPELLSPAGNPEKLKAALLFGARRRIPCRAELRNALAGRKLHDPGTVRCRGAGTQYGAQGVPDTQHHAAHERVPCPAPLPGRVARLSAGCRNRCRSRRTGNRQRNATRHGDSHLHAGKHHKPCSRTGIRRVGCAAVGTGAGTAILRDPRHPGRPAARGRAGGIHSRLHVRLVQRTLPCLPT